MVKLALNGTFTSCGSDEESMLYFITKLNICRFFFCPDLQVIFQDFNFLQQHGADFVKMFTGIFVSVTININIYIY